MPSSRHVAWIALVFTAATLDHGGSHAIAQPVTALAGATEEAAQRPVKWRLSTESAARRLRAAYPDAIAEAHADHIVWRDGTIMPVAADAPPTGDDPVLDSEDLRAIFQWPYPTGAVMPTTTAPPSGDPGRARPRRFFDKLYGDCANGDVRKALKRVRWVAGAPGTKSVLVNPLHGAADRLAAVVVALSGLPGQTKSRFLESSGVYNCRRIAGTARPSAHGYGIAIDIAVAQADYWRWSKPDSTGLRAYRNKIPAAIVAAFEANGFIWGGRWRHFDTMHFEYRPELVAP